METVCDKEVRFKRDFLSRMLIINFAIHIQCMMEKDSN